MGEVFFFQGPGLVFDFLHISLRNDVWGSVGDISERGGDLITPSLAIDLVNVFLWLCGHVGGGGGDKMGTLVCLCYLLCPSYSMEGGSCYYRVFLHNLARHWIRPGRHWG